MVTELEFKQGVIYGQNLVIIELRKRLDAAEKIMEYLFIETDETEIFKGYCKFCSENEECEWGDNFPYCLSLSNPNKKVDSHSTKYVMDLYECAETAQYVSKKRVTCLKFKPSVSEVKS